MRVSERQQALVFAVVLLTAIAGLWAAVKAMRPSCETGTVTAILEVRGDRWTAGPEARTIAGCTVWDLLADWSAAGGTSVEVQQYGEPLDAKMVVAIGPDRNGDAGAAGPHLFWQFWVDCTYASAGADLTPLHGGEHVTWVFAPEHWEGSVC